MWHQPSLWPDTTELCLDDKCVGEKGVDGVTEGKVRSETVKKNLFINTTTVLHLSGRMGLSPHNFWGVGGAIPLAFWISQTGKMARPPHNSDKDRWDLAMTDKLIGRLLGIVIILGTLVIIACEKKSSSDPPDPRESYSDCRQRCYDEAEQKAYLMYKSGISKLYEKERNAQFIRCFSRCKAQ